MTEIREALRENTGMSSGPDGMGGMRVVVHFPVGKEQALFSLLSVAAEPVPQPNTIAAGHNTAWLIERRVSPPEWAFDRDPTGIGAFASDIHRAHRFTSKERAEEAMRGMRITPADRGQFFVSEHIWVNSAETPQSALTATAGVQPIAAGQREAVAQIIDPDAVLPSRDKISQPGWEESWKIALRKADQILAILAIQSQDAVVERERLGWQAVDELKRAIRPLLDASEFSEHVEIRKAFNHAAILAGRRLDLMQLRMGASAIRDGVRS
jgi:hypothetical protein